MGLIPGKMMISLRLILMTNNESKKCSNKFCRRKFTPQGDERYCSRDCEQQGQALLIYKKKLDRLHSCVINYKLEHGNNGSIKFHDFYENQQIFSNKIELLKALRDLRDRGIKIEV